MANPVGPLPVDLNPIPPQPRLPDQSQSELMGLFQRPCHSGSLLGAPAATPLNSSKISLPSAALVRPDPFTRKDSR